ncbi:ATP-grasp domain-containing protein [Streptomyces sp. NPDC005065]|uniref:ATP-grasp domain-containing protein n=1 Tax=unclassified Streptomyces TaxID=2593676 RepID=UPI0033AD66BC
MTDTLLLVGAGIMGRGYVNAAHDLGLRTVLLDDEAWRDKHESRVAHFATPSGGTETHWLEAALHVAERHRPNGAVPFAEQHVLAAAWVQERLGLPGPSLAAADASRNKAVQRALFAQADLPQPGYAVVDSADSAAEWSRGRYPVVVKPLRGTGSAGVCCCASEDELRADLARRDVGQQLLVEEYVDAPEYSWEGLVQNGEVIFGNYTRKVTTGPPEFVELQHLLPWVHSDRNHQDRLDQETSALVAAAGIRTGLVHLEFRDNGTALLPMEFAVRTPGDHIMELMCRAYGHDFFGSVIELSLGRAVRLPTARPRTAGVVFLPAPRPGRIESLHGTEEAAARPEVVRVGQKKYPGDVVGGLHSSGDRVAHVLLTAGSAAEVDAAAEAVRRQIDIRMTPDEASQQAPATPERTATPAELEVADDGPTVVLCKWRPDMITALLASTPHLYLVLDEADRAKAAAAPEITGAARGVYRVGSLDSVEELTGVAVDLSVRGVRVDQVLCFSEDSQLGSGHLRTLLGCGGDTAPLVQSAVRDKRMMKQLVAAAGVPVAEWASLPAGATFTDGDSLPDVGFPAVVKPAYGFGTMSTVRVESPQEITDFVQNLPKSERLRSDHLIVERFVQGRELHIDALWQSGRPLFLTASSYYVPRLDHVTDGGDAARKNARDGSYIIPRQDHPELYERLLDLHNTVNGALGIENAVTHLEVFETPGGELVFSEIATRVGGGWIPDMLTAHLGRSVHRTIATGLLYGHAEAPEPPYRHIGALHLRPSHAGTLTTMPTDEQIRSVAGVLDWRRMKQPGDTVGFTHAMDWCLLVILGADTAEEYAALADRIETDLIVEVQ